MKKIILAVTIFMSLSARAGDSIFDSKDLPGPAKQTALCQGTHLSRAGARVVSEALDNYLNFIAARAYLAPSANEPQKFSWLKNLITTDADDQFTGRFLAPLVAKVEGEAQIKAHGLYGVRMAATLRSSYSYAQFKYLYTATFGAYNCDKMHYRGLSEALHDQFSN